MGESPEGFAAFLLRKGRHRVREIVEEEFVVRALEDDDDADDIVEFHPDLRDD